MINSQIKKPLLLIILDGWGHRDEVKANAIAGAVKPNWDKLLHTYPHTLISGSGHCVGLPEGQMGNSEVGHLTMGAGRIVHQDLTRIDLAIADGSFFSNKVLTNALQQTKAKQSALHVIGLMSPGGVHSHENHVQALIKLAAQHGLKNVYLHAILDGRDTPPQSALASLQHLTAYCEQMQCGTIVSIIGRYYAMDRDQRWDRIEKAYQLLVEGKGVFHNSSAIAALNAAYARGENDEFVQATAIHSHHAQASYIQNDDTVVFMNFRADRARELTQSLTDPAFNAFVRNKVPALSQFVCLTQYDVRFQLPVAFPPLRLNNLLTDCLANAKLKQLRLAETEKYAHVTFFFNGGKEQAVLGEERLLIPSPKVATYDLQPEMSAFELTEALIKAIQKQEHEVIICNFANPDMVGHTGNYQATVQAITIIDQCLGKIIAELQKIGGEAIITADHGNAEKMYNFTTSQPHTAHTSEPVPFIYIGRSADLVLNNGNLADIAPTILYLLGLPKPAEMTGQSLLKLR